VKAESPSVFDVLAVAVSVSRHALIRSPFSSSCPASSVTGLVHGSNVVGTVAVGADCVACEVNASTASVLAIAALDAIAEQPNRRNSLTV
jgi:hypothetical protein